VQSLEPALGPSFAHHPPGLHWPGNALEVTHAQFGEVEQAANEPPRPRADHHAIWLS
jgi:hypothetical protein